MKNIKYLLVAGVVFLSSACVDFLDHPLTTAISDDNIGEIVQRDPSKLNDFLAAGYRKIGSIQLYGRQMPYMATSSHEMNIDWLGEEQRNQWATNNYTAGNENIRQAYVKYYEALSSVNLVLDLIDHIDMEALSDDNNSLVSNIKGEALFLRAFIHFDLVRLFGEKGPSFGGGYPANKDAMGIVLMDRLADDQTAIAPRATIEQTYASILDDLEEAEKSIGDNQIPVNTAHVGPGYLDEDWTLDWGWAQKPAVIALRGKVYLYMNDYANAKTYFDRILADGRFKLDKPVNFTDYIQHTDNNAESIFALQYYNSSTGSAYEGAPEHHMVRIFGGGPGSWKNYFIDQSTAARFGVGSGEGPDPRLYEVTLYDYTFEDTPVPTDPDTGLPVTPVGDENFVLDDGAKWATATEGPVFKKINPNEAGFRYSQRRYTDFYKTSNQVFSRKNIEMIRLGDVYLMYAEVMLGLDDVATATEYVNKVRRRAYDAAHLQNYDTAGPHDLSAVTLPVIQEERWKELFFECNTRWFDICRWGILDTELAKYPSTLAGVVRYDPQDYYWPMPESELRSNPAIKQSRGY